MRWITAITGGVILAAVIAAAADSPQQLPYPIVDTGQTRIFSEHGQLLRAPAAGDAFYGQDEMYEGLVPAYKDDGDGTITDLNTGLMWVQARGSKVTFTDAVAGASKCRVGGYTDWRMPTITSFTL